MGLTLQVYIFNRLVRTFVWFVAGIGALALLVDFTELSNRTGSLPDYTIAAALGISAMRVPFILQVAIPFVMLFATMTTLIQLNRKYELVVARSAGVSAWQFLAPTWVAALAIGLFCVVVLNPVAATGYSLAQQSEGLWKGANPGGLFGESDPWLRQDREGGGSIIIGADRVAAENVTLFNAVFLEIGPDGTAGLRHDAERAVLSDGTWILTDVTTNGPARRPETRDRVTFATTLDESVIREALVPPEMVPFFALAGQIEAARSFGVPANPFRMQFHSLLSLPLLLVVMALIASTVSLRFVRFGQSAGMILGGIAAGFVLYVLTALAKSFGSAGAIPPVVAAWLPVLAGGLFGTAWLLHREDG